MQNSSVKDDSVSQGKQHLFLGAVFWLLYVRVVGEAINFPKGARSFNKKPIFANPGYVNRYTMKKSKERVKQFLSTFRPAGEKDEFLITLFLGKRKIKSPFADNPSLESSQVAPLTYEQFETWYNSDLPSVGEVVKSSDSKIIGLVTEEKWNSAVTGVMLASGNLLFDNFTLRQDEWIPASVDETGDLQKALAVGGYDWSQISRSLIERKIPQSARYVRLMVLGRQVGIGIFKGTLPDNTLEMYCVLMDDKPLQYGDDLCLGDADKFSYSDAYKEHRVIIQNALAEHNLIWNTRCQRIQRNIARAKPGKGYFWVSSYLEIKWSIEKGTVSDNRRFIRGNYFLSRVVALRVRDKMIYLLREEMLAEDNL